MRKLLIGSLVLSALLAIPLTAHALAVMMPQQPSPARAALTDAIVVGRVMGMEDVDVKVPVAPGAAQTTTYRIAIVAVNEVVRGKAGTKQVRVGFPATNMVNPGPGGGPAIRPGIGMVGSVQLTIGQEGLLYLQKHATGDFYVLNNRFDFVSNENKAGFEKELKDAQRAAKLLDNPMEGLKSKEAADRYFTAALLITQYRTYRGNGPAKLEPISVEESKLILEALAENDNWKGQVIKGGPVKGPGGIKGGPIRMDPMAPQQLFGMLGVTPMDGFVAPAQIATPDDYPNACRDWCRKNAGTYQIKRFVSAK